MLRLAFLLLLSVFASGGRGERGLRHGPLLLATVPAASTLPLSAFGLPDPSWGPELWVSCGLGAMPVGTPLARAALQLRADGVYLGEDRLMTLVEGRPPPGGDLEGHVALHRALERMSAESQAALDRGCAPWLLEGEPAGRLDRLLLLVDRDLPFEIVGLVAWEARVTGFARLAFAVRGPAREPWSPGVTSASEPLVLHLGGGETAGALLREMAETSRGGAVAPRTLVLGGVTPARQVTEPVGPRKHRHAGLLSEDDPLRVLMMDLPTGPARHVPRAIVGGGLGPNWAGREARDRALPDLIWVSTRARGALAETMVRDRLQRLDHKLRLCYGRGLLQDTSLAGDLSLRFVVDADGHAQELAITGDSLADPAVTHCVSTIVGVVGWADLHPTGPTEVQLTLRFQPLAASP